MMKKRLDVLLGVGGLLAILSCSGGESGGGAGAGGAGTGASAGDGGSGAGVAGTGAASAGAGGGRAGAPATGGSAGSGAAGGSAALGGTGATTGGSAGVGAAGSGGSSGGTGATGGDGGASGGDGGASGGGAGGTPGTAPVVGSCSVFTDDDHWNRDISAAPVDATWTQRLQNLVGSVNIHPDFGGPYGIPINVVPASQPAVPIAFDWYPSESDPGPYPFPDPGAIAIEGDDPTNCSGDCHVLVVQEGTCMLYEGYACEHQADGWHCGNGAMWDLTQASYGQRPKGWTSADAAGLPIAPGIVRFDEVAAGEVRHAIRFTTHCTRPNYVEPATHLAVPNSCNASDPNAPPMGLRVRLNASFDISTMPQGAQVILTAMKKYGMILADNGSDFYFQGDVSPGWTDAVLDALKSVPASAFEAIVPPPLEP